MRLAFKPSAVLHTLLLPFIALTLLSTMAQAKVESTVKLPVRAELLAFDGKAARDLDLTKGEPIKLSKKRHQIVFELRDSFGTGNNREQFTSRPFIISFHPVDGRKYVIEAPKLMNRRQADAINRDPASKITVTNEKQEEVSFEIAVLPSRGVQIGRNYAADVRRFNLTDNEAAVPELAGVHADQSFSGFTNAQQDSSIYSGSEENSPEENAMAERMLKYWFQEADSATRKSFLNWAGNLK